MQRLSKFKKTLQCADFSQSIIDKKNNKRNILDILKMHFEDDAEKCI